MNFQLALDRLSREECLRILNETEQYIDWIEIGTGVIKEYGMTIVKEIRTAYPDKTIVADMKTCDAAEHETKQVLQAGADITTVMAFSHNQTIQKALEAAEKEGGEIMVDLLNSPPERIAELDELGVTLVSLHIGKDQQSEKMVGSEDFIPLQPFPGMKAAAAGGINAESVMNLREVNPYTVIVGSAVTKAHNPAEAARAVREAIDK
ncbi:MAG: Fe-S cluster assembly protein HesB [Alkalicoccus sp.]|nr:MAG: Fe-S cluster assembly protein HesB [Alkalicoccus sp.]